MMNFDLTPFQARRLRLKAQRLLPAPDLPDTPLQVLEAVAGVQAQDLGAALLSVRVRSQGLTAAQVERALKCAYATLKGAVATRPDALQPSIAWIWSLRGTLHLVSRRDAAWLIPLLGPALVAGDAGRRLALGWDKERSAAGVDLIKHALEEKGRLTRPEIVKLLRENGLPWEGQAPVHLLFKAELEGEICLGPAVGKQPAWVLLESWIGKLQPLPRAEAITELARRYLAAYAPAAPEDFGAWSGLKLGEARQAWQALEPELAQGRIQGQPAWMLRTQLPWLEEAAPGVPCVRLLPRFDTYLLGYARRDLAIEPAYAGRVNNGGGLIAATLLVDGRVEGTWKSVRRRGALEVHVEPFADLSAGLLPAIEAEVHDMGRFLGGNAELSISSQ